VFCLAKAIEIKGLSKFYKDLKAVDNVSLSIEEGCIFGLLGPNGAGKTTLISILITMRKPSDGTAKYQARWNGGQQEQGSQDLFRRDEEAA